MLNDADGYVPIGDTFTYTITVTNTGNTDIPVVPAHRRLRSRLPGLRVGHGDPGRIEPGLPYLE